MCLPRLWPGKGGTAVRIVGREFSSSTHGVKRPASWNDVKSPQLFERYRQMTSERIRDSRFVILMTLAGLASGVLTAALSDGHLTFDLGIPFGVSMAFSLAITGTVPCLWTAV